jgi:uncharacterized protein
MTVTTIGTAGVPARPDRATVVVDVERLAAEPDEALSDVVRRVEEVRALLVELGVPEGQWSTTGVSVGEQREWRQDREVVVGHRAVERVQVRLVEPAQMGALLREAVRRVGASVRGPFWVVDAQNPARVEAYRLAAGDARRRAAAYADALGCTLGAVVEVREPGVAEAAPVVVHRAFARAAAAEAVPVDPGEVDVHATVVVTFALAPAAATRS